MELAQQKGGGRLLRVAVEPGGCHGFQYRFELVTPPPQPDDVVFERDGGRVVVDEGSLALLAGAQVDYSRELIGRAFRVIANPLATSGCGCGISFTAKT